MSDIQQYLIAFIQKERFALDICFVQEIIKQSVITKVPTKLPYLIGVTKIRDFVVPLVSIRKKLYDLNDSVDDSVVIILEEPFFNNKIGLVVDAVEEVVSIPAEAIDRPILFSGSDPEMMVSGIAKLKNGLAVILDGTKLFSDLDYKAFEKAIKSAEKKGVSPIQLPSDSIPE